ncbi:hypothetical protein CV_1449 [Chromobacterium violaceum ATCC 12472]|uniref:Uncharacterized protein n=1 Tax=Chromobacterium violaceum (strain ATCC 12472 / DSM 30191 / JCM 1249 / CCUG 213 / NBRC 12614 / NCIMB 9131 / NCTC 9757 / MK) TaxID=243365 RepID=Q7NY26_CHRVO|nr:hypothetical protein CV_1449 [Chromobacterium violaceum ATCC 12472]
MQLASLAEGKVRAARWIVWNNMSAPEHQLRVSALRMAGLDNPLSLPQPDTLPTSGTEPPSSPQGGKARYG